MKTSMMVRPVAALAMVAVAVACSPSHAALLHRYTFDNIGGTSAIDTVGNADGTLSGDAVITANGLELNLTPGVARDGLVSLLTSATDAANGIDIASYGELTVDLWATPNANLNNSFSTAVGFGKVNSFNANWAGEYFLLSTHRGDNVSRTALSNSDGDTPWASEEGANGPELNDNAMHHYRAVINSSEIRLFVDDMNIPTGSSALNTNSLANVSNELAWIGDLYPGDQNWAGTVHELRIYNNAIPEPSTLVLVGLAGVGLLVARRRVA